MNAGRVVQLLWLSVILAVSFFITVPINRAVNSSTYDMCVITTFIVNGLLIVFMLIAEVKRRPYSLVMIHWVFCLFFFFFAPLSQYITRGFPWGIEPSDDILLRANIICLLWTVLFSAGLHWENMHKLLAKIGNNTVIRGGGKRIVLENASFYSPL